MDPYLQIGLQRAAIEQGTTGEMVGKINQLRDFEGVATAKLLRLLTGVSLVEEPKIKPSDQEVRFKLQITPDALTGQYRQIACDVTITDSGQETHQQTGDGVLRIDLQRN